MSRTFKVAEVNFHEHIGHNYGRYVSKSPTEAAPKAARSLFNLAKENNIHKEEIKFILVESTRGSGKDGFCYVAKKTKLANPTIRTIKDKSGNEVTIKNEYSYKVTSCHSLH